MRFVCLAAALIATSACIQGANAGGTPAPHSGEGAAAAVADVADDDSGCGEGEKRVDVSIGVFTEERLTELTRIYGAEMNMTTVTNLRALLSSELHGTGHATWLSYIFNDPLPFCMNKAEGDEDSKALLRYLEYTSPWLAEYLARFSALEEHMRRWEQQILEYLARFSALEEHMRRWEQQIFSFNTLTDRCALFAELTGDDDPRHHDQFLRVAAATLGADGLQASPSASADTDVYGYVSASVVCMVREYVRNNMKQPEAKANLFRTAYELASLGRFLAEMAKQYRAYYEFQNDHPDYSDDQDRWISEARPFGQKRVDSIQTTPLSASYALQVIEIIKLILPHPEGTGVGVIKEHVACTTIGGGRELLPPNAAKLTLSFDPSPLELREQGATTEADQLDERLPALAGALPPPKFEEGRGPVEFNAGLMRVAEYLPAPQNPDEDPIAACGIGEGSTDWTDFKTALSEFRGAIESIESIEPGALGPLGRLKRELKDLCPVPDAMHMDELKGIAAELLSTNPDLGEYFTSALQLKKVLTQTEGWERQAFLFKQLTLDDNIAEWQRRTGAAGAPDLTNVISKALTLRKKIVDIAGESGDEPGVISSVLLEVGEVLTDLDRAGRCILVKVPASYTTKNGDAIDGTAQIILGEGYGPEGARKSSFIVKHATTARVDVVFKRVMPELLMDALVGGLPAYDVWRRVGRWHFWAARHTPNERGDGAITEWFARALLTLTLPDVRFGPHKRGHIPWGKAHSLDDTDFVNEYRETYGDFRAED